MVNSIYYRFAINPHSLKPNVNCVYASRFQQIDVLDPVPKPPPMFDVPWSKS